MHLLPAFLLALAASAASAPQNQKALSGRPNASYSEPGVPGVDAFFDYVVVGGGTAGITVAARLAEKDFSVALVEAGTYYKLRSLTAFIPGADSIKVGASPSVHPAIDWGFVARNVPGANYRDIHYARGKCLGGSSALNFMIYQRPTKESMQLWADLVDDQSYTFEKVLPFYKRTVQFAPPHDQHRPENATAEYALSAFSEDGQPLQVSYPNYAMSFSSWMRGGMQAIGINETQDFSSGSLFGAQYCPSTIEAHDQTRSTSQTAFLTADISHLRTLTVYKNTLAKKILFDSQKRAIGVRVQSGLLEYSLKATREVIVSAGAFQSPQLLMVSGIGPSHTLEKYGIEVLSNLPGVGQNMWDHPFFGPTYRVALVTFTKLAADFTFLIKQLLLFLLSHIGMLTNPVTDFLAFEKVPKSHRAAFSAHTEEALSQFPSDWPEVEYLSAAAYVGNFSRPFLQQPNDGSNYAGIIASLVSPTSRGNVTIISNDTTDLPVINPNWLATETDQQVAIAAYRRIRAAFHSKAMAPIVLGEEYHPGSQYETNAQILSVIRNTVMTIFHAACTCKMGVRNDSQAVVDSRARVFGVNALRVVDVSAFPILVPGHPQSSVYMLAEKIAEDIIATS
ncbi:Gmc oxidoreductase [Aspergillus sp. HF37]|nr:Gmc oxidoreductase [Aspergillus sp. HF37]